MLIKIFLLMQIIVNPGAVTNIFFFFNSIIKEKKFKIVTPKKWLFLS